MRNPKKFRFYSFTDACRFSACNSTEILFEIFLLILLQAISVSFDIKLHKFTLIEILVNETE